MRWPSMLWVVVMLCLLGWGLLWWFVLGAGRAARGRALQARIRLWERTHPPPSAATLRALHRVAQDARRAMRATGGRQGLHRQPWVLVVGDPAADLLSLLAAAHPAGPIASAAADDGV